MGTTKPISLSLSLEPRYSGPGIPHQDLKDPKGREEGTLRKEEREEDPGFFVGVSEKGRETEREGGKKKERPALFFYLLSLSLRPSLSLSLAPSRQGFEFEGGGGGRGGDDGGEFIHHEQCWSALATASPPCFPSPFILSGGGGRRRSRRLLFLFGRSLLLLLRKKRRQK